MARRAAFGGVTIIIALAGAGPAFGETPGEVYRTVIGAGSNYEYGRDVAIDQNGDAFVLGYTDQDDSFGDAVVAKLSPEGEVLFQVMIGGTGLDVAGGIALDANGDVYIAGRTLSGDFPVMNAIQPTLHGPADAFLTKISGQDGSIMMSTFLGGARGDDGYDVAIAPDGSIVIVGGTESIDFPTVNPIQGSLTLIDCFCDDVFVTRLGPDAQTITFSTYLGGTYTDSARQVGVDAAGRIYVAGQTDSPNFPLANAAHSSLGGGDTDVFAFAIDPDAGQLIYSTYLGGEDLEYVWDMDVSADGKATMTGTTRSIFFPTTPDAYEPNFVGAPGGCGGGAYIPIRNCDDGFVVTLEADGTQSMGTFLGGLNDDDLRALAVAPDGRIRVAGNGSNGFPGEDFVPNPIPTPHAVFTELSADGSTLNFTARIDTNTPGSGHGLAVGADGETVFAGAVGIPTGPNMIQRDLLIVELGTADACAADMAAPEGVLDFSDVTAFLAAFVAMDPIADMSEPFGQFDFSDVTSFLAAFAGGCP
ncbi:MAG: SBBP repeat-containing protein [Phycisphaerales bacterium]